MDWPVLPNTMPVLALPSHHCMACCFHSDSLCGNWPVSLLDAACVTSIGQTPCALLQRSEYDPCAPVLGVYSSVEVLLV
jgi:hypothetical protein